ncbi:hypothetical protein MRX96_057531 [Rhipicephalus microplus]
MRLWLLQVFLADDSKRPEYITGPMQIILKASGLAISDRTSSDQIRVNSVNHTILISTPDLGRADLYYVIRL